MKWKRKDSSPAYLGSTSITRLHSYGSSATLRLSFNLRSERNAYDRPIWFLRFAKFDVYFSALIESYLFRSQVASTKRLTHCVTGPWILPGICTDNFERLHFVAHASYTHPASHSPRCAGRTHPLVERVRLPPLAGLLGNGDDGLQSHRSSTHRFLEPVNGDHALRRERSQPLLQPSLIQRLVGIPLRLRPASPDTVPSMGYPAVFRWASFEPFKPWRRLMTFPSRWTLRFSSRPGTISPSRPSTSPYCPRSFSCRTSASTGLCAFSEVRPQGTSAPIKTFDRSFIDYILRRTRISIASATLLRTE